MVTALLLFVLVVGPLVDARPYVAYENRQSDADLITAMNAVLQSNGQAQGSVFPFPTVESQGLFGSLFKTVGGALCKAGYDPRVVAETLLSQNSNMNEVEVQGFKRLLKSFGSNLCDYITADKGQPQPTSQGRRVPFTQGRQFQWPQSTSQGRVVPFTQERQFLWPSSTSQGRVVPFTQGRRFPWPQLQSTNQVELEGFLSTFKKVGSALCRAASDGSNPIALPQHFQQLDEAEIEGITDFLKRFGANLCEYVKDSDGGPTQQGWNGGYAVQENYDQSKIELSSAEMQGFFKTAKKVGSALCRAALDTGSPRAAVQSLGVTEEVEIQRFTDFFKRFGSNLCDYITADNGAAGTPSMQRFSPIIWSPNSIHFDQQQKAVQTQGVKTIAKNIGSALCRAALDRDNPTAVAQSFGLTDEVEIQQFTDFLKRFGKNLCDYFTSSGGQTGTPSEQEETAEIQEVKTIAKNIGSALCRAALDKGNPTVVAQSLGLNGELEIQQFTDFLKRFGTNLCDFFTQNGGSVGASAQQTYTPIVWTPFGPRADAQGLKDIAKKIGSALCRAAYDSPAAEVEGIIAQGKLDQAEAQHLRDFLKSFGSNLCDYITQDGEPTVEATVENDLAQELMDVEE